MSLALYRKYRPQTFADVVGQNHIKTTIQSELENNKLAHAFIFSGPRGLGKTTMARLLAKAVNCLKRGEGKSEPCNECEACLEIMQNHSLDVIEIDAASHTGVDNVRENIIANARFTPTSRKYKVFIIDEVHMLSVAAFNALLKTLEEPPQHAIFIMATTEIHKVPQTIISRCQHFDFRKVNKDEIIVLLNKVIASEKKKVDASVIEDIAHYSEGCIRDAESLLGQILSLADERITAQQAELVLPHSYFELGLELIDYLVKKETTAAIFLINRLVQEGVDLNKFTQDLVELLRKLLLIKINSNLGDYAAGFNKETEARIKSLADLISTEQLVKMIEVFLAKKGEIKFSEIPQLPLELAIVLLSEESSVLVERGSNDDKFGGGLAAPVIAAKMAIKEPKVPVIEPQEEAPKKAVGKIKLSLKQVKDKWGDVLVCLKKYNFSLASTLRICQPQEVDEQGCLQICTKHKFHQQRLNELKNKQILEKVIEEIFGQRLAIKTVVVDELPDNNFEISALAEEKQAGGLDDILKNFGGQLID